jgi:hypothetical protein
MDLVRRKIFSEVVMRLPKQVVNPALAALIEGSGYRSLERFAQAVNVHGWEMQGVKTSYDHVTVKRWLGGSVCQNPEVVASLLSEAWGIPVPASVIWPELREGARPVPAHLVPWVAARTLETLAAFVGSDMLSRREILADSVKAATGSALVDPVSRWLGVGVVGLAARPAGSRRVGLSDVVVVERSTRVLAATDAEVGGSLSREAAVGQLKYALDLARYGSYTDAVGNRLLAAVAGLSGLVGWMCHDSGMAGPAQRYLTLGLQAARESTDPRSPLLVVRILADLAQQLRWAGQDATAVRLFDLALSQLPSGRERFSLTRAIVTSTKAQALCYLGPTAGPEVRSAVALSADLLAQAGADERAALAAVAHRSVDVSAPELSAKAADAYMVLAKDDPRLAEEAQASALYALTNIDESYGRNKTLAQIRLARVRFAAGEPDQACDDGETALTMTERMGSAMVAARLRELYADMDPYRDRPRVQELRERLRATVG